MTKVFGPRGGLLLFFLSKWLPRCQKELETLTHLRVDAFHPVAIRALDPPLSSSERAARVCPGSVWAGRGAAGVAGALAPPVLYVLETSPLSPRPRAAGAARGFERRG